MLLKDQDNVKEINETASCPKLSDYALAWIMKTFLQHLDCIQSHDNKDVVKEMNII